MWRLEKESEIRAWIAPIIMSVADTAVDRQQGRNRDFARYAAQAAACKRAYLELKCLGEHAPDIRFHHTAVDNLRDAFEEAHRELEYVVTMLPYSPLSEKYRCSCGLSLVYCTCMYRCKCDEWISRWPWQLQDLEDACKCSPRRLSAVCDWQRFVRYVMVTKYGERRVAQPAFGPEEKGKFKPERCVWGCDFCPQTGVCLLHPSGFAKDDTPRAV